MRNLLCYGDSNTWGYIPGSGGRFPADVRWPGVMLKALGGGWTLHEDGVNGRTTVWESPFEDCRSGLLALGYALRRTRPLDLAVIMLGTNDLSYTDAYGYYRGLKRLALQVLNADVFHPDAVPAFTGAPRLLLVSPITLHPDVERLRPEIHVAHKYEASARFAAYTQQLAQELHTPWLNAAEYARASSADCLHMDAANHRALGLAIAEKVKSLFSEE